MGPVEQQVVDLIEPTVQAMGYELLGIEFLGQGIHSRLRLFIDKDTGITLEDCEQVSRQVSALMDVEDPIHGQYSLEVSSPGTDRPLFKLAHFVRFVGHGVKLRLRQPQAGQRNFKGKIFAIEEAIIVLHMGDGAEVRVNVRDVEKANLVPEF
jgi:ribosome maturation factor RimP